MVDVIIISIVAAFLGGLFLGLVCGHEARGTKKEIPVGKIVKADSIIFDTKTGKFIVEEDAYARAAEQDHRDAL